MCDETSTEIIVYACLSTFVTALLACPVIFGGSRALWKLNKAGKFGAGPVTWCIVFIVTGTTFGFLFLLENSFRKSLDCGHTGLMQAHLTSTFTTIFAMFYILSVVQLVLIWLDVWVKSITMQKSDGSNSLVSKYRKILKAFSICFGVVSVAAYAVAIIYFIMLTFLVGIGMLVVWPVGAMKLSNLLTDTKATGGCCAELCPFLIGAIKSGLFGLPNKERENALVGADPNSSKGKFLATRYNMAGRVENTFVRVWLCIFIYMVSGVLYAGSVTSQVVSPCLKLSSTQRTNTNRLQRRETAVV